MNHSFGRAKQKFFEALYALSGASTIDIGLTHAANYLVQLQPKDLPVRPRKLICSMGNTPRRVA